MALQKLKNIIKKINKNSHLPDWYKKDLSDYNKMLYQIGSGEELKEFPQLYDKTSTTGFDHHYVYQGPWVFEKLLKTSPKKHVDVGSQINYMGFFSAVFPTTFVDIRPTKADFSNFTELKGSILNMPYKNKSVESLSCLHVIEHIGLGRYGDKIDPMGSTKACKELQRVVSKKGNLFVSVTVGKEVTYFNAHRVFNPSTIFEYFDELDLVKFDAINDKGDIVHDIDPKKAAFFDYGCGLFWFTRK
jgi:hypothetical protein